MLISIIIPAYKCAKTIEKTVESVFGSGLSDYEIVIVNDGSHDETDEVLRGLAERFDTVRVVEQENAGVSAARNRGIREAEGDYLLFVDADDTLEAGGLAEGNGILKEQRPDMLLFGMRFDYYVRGRLYRSDALRYPKSGCMSAEEWSAELEQLYRCNMLSPVWNKLIRRSLVTENGIGFREDMIEMEDYLFSVECLARCDQIYLLDQAAYRYRQAEDERATFNRLWRIDSLSDYVQPYYDAAALFGPYADSVDRIADRIYVMLFREQIRFASVGQIRAAAEDMLAGGHAEIIRKTDAELYRRLEKKQYVHVWCRRAISRLRHWTAVRVKYRRSGKESR